MSRATTELRRLLRKQNIELVERLQDLPSDLAKAFGDPAVRGVVIAVKYLPDGMVVGEAISLQIVSDVDQHPLIAKVIADDLRRIAQRKREAA